MYTFLLFINPLNPAAQNTGQRKRRIYPSGRYAGQSLLAKVQVLPPALKYIHIIDIHTKNRQNEKKKFDYRLPKNITD